MKHQANNLEKAKEILIETKGDEFYRDHAEYIEDVYAELDEDSKVEFKTFMTELNRNRRMEISHREEVRRKLDNAKNFLIQTNEPTFFTKYSDFIDDVYAEFRSPGDSEYLSEFGKFSKELWEKRNPKPRINVMRMKQTQALHE